MPKHRNPAHLDNFYTNAKNFYRIVSPYVHPKGEPSVLVYATGRTPDEVKENFYTRFMARPGDREMMLGDQKRGGFVMQSMLDGRLSFVEGPLVLLSEVTHAAF